MEESGRSKRGGGRERKAAGEEKEDRRDRDRDREKEKEPAWMETYVPTTPAGGILGGKSTEGELDGLQAWKKGMKAKEEKEKAKVNAAEGKTKGAAVPSPATPANAEGLDEIQLFKLMMKKEEAKKNAPASPSGPEANSQTTSPPQKRDDKSGKYCHVIYIFLHLTIVLSSCCTPWNTGSGPDTTRQPKQRYPRRFKTTFQCIIIQCDFRRTCVSPLSLIFRWRHLCVISAA